MKIDSCNSFPFDTKSSGTTPDFKMKCQLTVFGINVKDCMSRENVTHPQTIRKNHTSYHCLSQRFIFYCPRTAFSVIYNLANRL